MNGVTHSLVQLVLLMQQFGKFVVAFSKNSLASFKIVVVEFSKFNDIRDISML